MKKSIVVIIFLLSSKLFFAQDLTSKKGEPYLPEAKEFCIGVDLGQVINYVNGFLKTEAPASASPSISAFSIFGKYFKNEKKAYRGSLSIGFNSYDASNMVLDRIASTNSVSVFPAAVNMKENIWNRKTSLIGLSFGIENRRGKTRLQGLYGAEVGLSISNSKDKFTYGNALNASIISPVDVDSIADAMYSPIFGDANNINQNANTIIQGKVGNARIIERNNGTSVTFGLRAFAGIEYFLFPKMSIGGEFGLGLAYTSGARATTIWESIGQSINSTSSEVKVGSTTTDGSKQSYIKFNSDNLNSIFGASAALKLNFYF